MRNICPLLSAVHPRWRGEHLADGVILADTHGSSPLARGTLLVLGQPFVLVRFIPAGAGNTAWSLRPSSVCAVHPRWRGEHADKRSPDHRFAGSSPLARGTRSPPPSNAASRAVHPRWRGEHQTPLSGRASRCGSSPLARGTQGSGIREQFDERFIPAGAGNTLGHLMATDDQVRFIPAGAGNTPCGPPRAWPPAVHPRWRGEH